ncbi:hypothetical protein Q2452_25275, partial [Escherichia coli]|nr:hypothetical protein [Escherichia coli]
FEVRYRPWLSQPERVRLRCLLVLSVKLSGKSSCPLGETAGRINVRNFLRRARHLLLSNSERMKQVVAAM